MAAGRNAEAAEASSSARREARLTVPTSGCRILSFTSERSSSVQSHLSQEGREELREIFEKVQQGVEAAKALMQNQHSRTGARRCSVRYPTWLIVSNLAALATIIYIEYEYHPRFEDEQEHRRPSWRAYTALMGLVMSVTFMVNGARSDLVFVGFLTMLTFTRCIRVRDALGGFARIGPWLPQLQLVIIKSIRGTGLLEEVLTKLLGKQPPSLFRAGLRLYCSALFLGALISAGPTIATATPMVIRWVKCYNLSLRPLMYLLVVGATCGNAILLTSSPSSMVVREIMCPVGDHCPLRVMEQSPLALTNAALLGIYAAMAGRWIERWDRRAIVAEAAARRRVRARTGWSSDSLDPEALGLGPAIGESRSASLLSPRAGGEPPSFQLTPAESSSEPSSERPVIASFEVEQPVETKVGSNTTPKRKSVIKICVDTVEVYELDTVEPPGDPLEDQARELQLHYEVEFVVLEGSSLCGHTAQSAGISAEDGILLMAMTRLGGGAPVEETTPGDTMTAGTSCRCDSTAELAAWRFEAGDIILARCSAAGLCAMRERPRVFVLRGLPCHYLLGGRRHERRLFEGVVSESSDLIGRTIEDLVGLGPHLSEASSLSSAMETSSGKPWFVRQFRGYPVAARRRERQDPVSIRPLSPRTDKLVAGDVVLVDAFHEFPTLPQTMKHFLLVSLVPNSQAPRHGRGFDKARGAIAVVALICAIMLEDLGMLPLIVGYLLVVALLLLTRAIMVSEICDSLSWNTLLTIGAGEGVATALEKTGLAFQTVKFIRHLDRWGGMPAMYCGLAITAQILANVLSPTPAAILVSPVAMTVAKGAGVRPECVSLLVIMACNMGLSLPAQASVGKKQQKSFTIKELFCWGLPAQLIVTVVAVCWAFSFQQHLPDPYAGRSQ